MENHSNIFVSIEEISFPITGNSIDFDLSKDEKFFQIKSEINKLENMDANKVKIACIQLLCHKVKDLRLFVYLIFSCLFGSHSLDEWSKALCELINCLLKYKSEIYPKRLPARIAALSWLNQERVKLIFMKQIEGIPYEKLIEYQQSVSQLNRSLAENIEYFGGEITLLFEKWLKAKIEASPVPIQEMPIKKEKGPMNNVKSEKIVRCSDSLDKIIKNMNEIESATMSILNYCELYGRWIQAASYRRSLRWAALMPKVDAVGVTALSSFSKKNELLLLECQKEYINFPKECYKKCEELFLLPGGQIKLDIQYCAIKSAKLFNSELAEFLKEALCGFVKRFPGVEKWQYNTKENCTSLIVVKWVQKEIIASNGVMVKIDNEKERKINDKYEMILKERELLLLKSICGIGSLSQGI